jgi:AsmA family protein
MDLLPRLAPGGRLALRIGSWALLGLFAILVLSLLFVALFDWDAARGPVARLVGSRLHREVHIEGPLNVHVFSSTPSIEVGGLRVGNPDWLPSSDMADVGRLRLALVLSQLLRFRIVFDRVEVAQARVNLVQDKNARANWQFEPGAASESVGLRLPVTRRFTLTGCSIKLDDQVHGVRFHGQMSAAEGSNAGSAEPFQLQGDGEINGEPFRLLFSGAALLNLRVDEPYAFHAVVTAGATHIDLRGRLPKPFDLGLIDAKVHMQGGNLADLYYLTGLALPRTAAYELSLQLERKATHLDLRDIGGKVGASDLRGNAAIELKGTRPYLTADVVSQSLRLVDMGIALGADGEAAKPAEFLLPRTQLKLDRLQQMDADAKFRATAVQAAKVPIQRVSMKVNLRDGVLKVEPVVFTLPEGTVSGWARIDTRPHPAAVSLDMRLADVQLEQFKKQGATDAPLKGTLQAHATLAGQGSSVHDVAASANGRITAVIPEGEIREALVELTGINVSRELGLLLSGKDRTAPIRCGVAEFSIAQGRADARQFVIDSEHVLVEGRGHVDFGDESLHLDFTGKPKSLRLVRLRTPINLRGTLEKPSVGIEARHAAVQGGLAAALSAVTPVAALLAFVDPGRAKDQNCAALEATVAPRDNASR